MTLQLDARQRAMLKEIGVRVWQPLPPPPAVEAPAPAVVRVASDAPSQASERENGAPVRTAAVSQAREQIPVNSGDPAPAAPAPQALPADIATMDWSSLQQAVANCQACELCKSRKNTVFGIGDSQAHWLVVGEAPGENEDLQGEPFVGAAGQLLDNMLKAVGVSRNGNGAQGAYIANVLKCRPPGNRNPQPQEVLQCEPYLRRQVELLQPKIILALGRFAVQTLLQGSVPEVATMPLGKMRGQVHQYHGVPVIVSYHPAYLLRTPLDKAKAWADLCLALETLRGAAGGVIKP
jgi:DNA polymerase